MLEAIGLFLIEVVFNVLVIIVWDFIFGAFANAFMPTAEAHKGLAGFGLLFLGFATGLLSLFVLNHRIAPELGFRGLSLIVAPAASGAFLELLGRQARAKGVEHTLLFTWWGGALFAFGVALGRFIQG